MRPRSVVRLNRFEKKILAALLAVAFVPLGAAMLLGLGALREAYSVGVNAKVAEELETGLEAQKNQLASLRELAQLRIAVMASDPVLREHVVEGRDKDAKERLAFLVEAQRDVVQAAVCHDEVCAPPNLVDPDPAYRYLVLDHPIAEVHVLRARVRAPWAPFRTHQASAQVVKTFKTLYAGQGRVTISYLGVYMLLLLSVICVTVAIGIILSRRVTRRVALLADATERVGAGNLDVALPVESSDEIAELTRAFNKMVEDLRVSRTRIADLQRIGAWQQFARRLAHEIKNPLTPIQLAVQEAEKGYAGDDTVHQQRLRQAREIVMEEVNTLRRLVTEFSNFAKLPTAVLQEEDLADELEDLARSTEAIMLDEESATGVAPAVTFEWTIERPLRARVDAMMLRRCLHNLLANAVQAMRGSSGTVSVFAGVVDGKVRIDVADEGPGVEERHRGDLFTPYFTRKTDGTGLGLAIVKKIVLEHEGAIQYVSDAGLGALFRIELPPVDATQAKTLDATHAQPPDGKPMGQIS